MVGMVGDGVEGGVGGVGEGGISSRSFDCMDTVALGNMMHWV